MIIILDVVQEMLMQHDILEKSDLSRIELVGHDIFCHNYIASDPISVKSLTSETFLFTPMK